MRRLGILRLMKFTNLLYVRWRSFILSSTSSINCKTTSSILSIIVKSEGGGHGTPRKVSRHGGLYSQKKWIGCRPIDSIIITTIDVPIDFPAFSYTFPTAFWRDWDHGKLFFQACLRPSVSHPPTHVNQSG